MVLLHPASASEADDFFEKMWPDVAVAGDPEMKIYDAFGLGRASLSRMFGLGSLSAAGRAALKGHGLGRPTGNVRRMPGMLLVHDGRVAWQHRFQHIGDHPDIDQLAAALRRATA